MPTSLGLSSGAPRPDVGAYDPEAVQTARTLRAVLLTLAVTIGLFLAVGVPLFVVRKRLAAAWAAAGLLVLLLSLLHLKGGRIRTAARTFLAGSWLLVTGWAVLSGELRSPGYVVLIVTAAWMLGRRTALRMAAASIVAGFGIAVAEAAGLLPLFSVPLHPSVAFSLLALAILLAAVPTSQVLRNLTEALARSRDQLAELKIQGEALERQRGLVERIWEGSQDAMCLVDEQGVLLRVNEALCRLVRKTREELEGRPYTVCLGSSDVEENLARYRQWFSVGVIEQPRRNWSFTLWNEVLLPVEVSLSHIDLPDGSRALLALVRDNTERMQAEASRQEAQRRLEEQKILADSIIDSLPGTFTMFDEEGRLLRWNKYEELLTGYSADELAAMNLLDTVAEGDRGRAAASIAEARATGRSALEVRLRDRAGDTRYHFWTAVTLELGGKLNGLCIGIDVTELKRAEVALQDAHARFEAIVESTPAVAIQGFDRKGRIRHWNNACTTMFGFEAREVVGRRAQDVLFWADRGAEFEAALQQVWETRVPLAPREWKMSIRDGSIITVYSSMFPIQRHGAVEAVFRMDVDVSRVHSLEDQLHQAQKLESLGGLAGGIAHDFNNLLTVINGYSRSALRRVDPGDPLYNEMEEVRKAGERAANLTRQLLAFSRKQELEPEVLDLNAIVKEFEHMLGRLIGANIEVRCVLETALPAVEADPGQLHQVIMNLAINARDAMPEGGCLTISTRSLHVREEEPEAVAVPPGEYVKLSVADTGHGMDENTRGHIFEPFFTTKAEGKGTGLGLSTVHGIVSQSGGHIRVHTELQRGTTFEIYLPAANVPIETDDGESSASGLRGSETVLVAEDDAKVRAFATASLSSYGYRVLEAGKGDEALRICREHSGRIDLLLSDVIMPGMSVGALRAEVRRLRPESAVLLMTGYSDPESLRGAGLPRGTDYLQKPFEPAQLARKVRGALDARVQRRA